MDAPRARAADPAIVVRSEGLDPGGDRISHHGCAAIRRTDTAEEHSTIHPRSGRSAPTVASTVVRLVTLAGSLGLTGGCDLFLGIPDLGDPGNLLSMKARFKATIQAEDGSPAPLDWGVADDRIWWHYMGPRGVAFCGIPSGAPEAQRAYQINFFRGSFGNIDELEVETPAHPPGTPPIEFCGTRPERFRGTAEP